MAKEAKSADEGSAASPNKGKKLLIIILALLLLLMVVGGGIAYKLLSSSHADEDDEYAEETVKPKKAKKKDHAAPVFVNLDPFTVNLVPETGDQYLQVTLSLELEGPDSEVALKSLMPRIRNNITLLLSSKKASELLPKDGKEQLAQALKNEINLAIEAPSRGNKGGTVDGPVQTVLFTSFIIQ